MRYRHVFPILIAAVVGTGCDSGSPVETAAPKVAPQAFLTEAQILKLTGTFQLGGTTIRTYAENFSETGVPCTEQVTINGSNFYTSFYSQTATTSKLTVLITSLGSGYGTPSGDKYTKYYINFQRDLGSLTGSPEKDFTLVQKFRITRAGDTVPGDDAAGDVYHHLRVNSKGEILESTSTSDVRCQ